MSPTVLWLLLLAIFTVVELVTGGPLVAIFIAAGAGVGAILSAAGLPLVVQAVGFAVASVAGIGLLRRPIVRSTSRGQYRLVSGALGMVGEEGVVTRDVGDITAPGKVRIHGEEWTSLADGNEVIPAGTVVTVLELRRSRLIVRRTP